MAGRQENGALTNFVYVRLFCLRLLPKESMEMGYVMVGFIYILESSDFKFYAHSKVPGKFTSNSICNSNSSSKEHHKSLVQVPFVVSQKR